MNKKTLTYWLLPLFIFGVGAAELQAQTNRLSFLWTPGPQVVEGATTLDHPFMGGGNLLQWSKVDLNHDGTEDLVAFERSGNRWLTFLAENGQWVSAPAYADSLPKIQYWGIFRDFNCDGKKDLFSFALGGMGVWENTSTNDSLSFTWALPGNFLTTQFFGNVTNLYNYNTDIPAILDVDNDGDLDIFTFGQRSTIEWHEGQTACGLDFINNTACWGRFEENANTNDLILNGCAGVQKFSGSEKTSGSVHAGSTVLVLHLNGDSLYDVLLGDVSFANLVAAYNGGTIDSAFMTAKDTSFPSIAPAHVEFFPASFYEDVDFDGDPELLVAPNLEGSINTRNTWLYNNTGTLHQPVWSTPDSAFLVDQFIDVGSAAKPALVDLDLDGDLDLVIGTDGVYTASGTYYSALRYYKNTGTPSAPSFELADDDLANAGFNNLGDGLAPTFGDLDGDLDADMLVGLADGRVIYYENTGNFLNHSFTYRGVLQNIDVGNHATPALGDLTGDGNPDLLIGNEEGHVAMYEWTGSFPNIFTLVSSQWAGIDMSTPSAPSGYSSPAILYGTDTTVLVGSMDAGVLHLDSIDVVLSGNTSVDVSLASGSTPSSTREATPFGGSKRNGRTQIIFSPEELTNAGGVFGQIEQIGFQMGATGSLYLTQGFTIKMKHVLDTAQVAFHNNGFTTVYDGIRVLTQGWNDINLSTPFVWNGVDPLMVEVCFSKHAQTGDIPVILGNTAFHSTLWGDVSNWNAITNDGCAMPYGGKLKTRPNMRFTIVPTLYTTDHYFLTSGKRLHPAMGDLNADGFPDAILGNLSGGIHYFEGIEFEDISVEEWADVLPEPCLLFPNPTTGRVSYRCDEVDVTGASVYNAMGERLMELAPGETYDLTLPKGWYLVRFHHTNGQTSVQRLLMQ